MVDKANDRIITMLRHEMWTVYGERVPAEELLRLFWFNTDTAFTWARKGKLPFTIYRDSESSARYAKTDEMLDLLITRYMGAKAEKE